MSDCVRICNLNSESFVLHKGKKKEKKKESQGKNKEQACCLNAISHRRLPTVLSCVNVSALYR
jgi:hypothetical protein